MNKIAVVLAVHNRKQLTDRFLASITKQSLDSYVVIVVDDGSTDGTSEMINEKYSDVQLLRGDGSLWWSASTNMAIKYALQEFNPDYICTMNDDTEADYHFLEELYKVAHTHPKSIVGCFSYDIKNPTNLLYDGSCVNWITGRISEVNSDKAYNKNRNIIDVTYYIGRGVLIPSDVFRQCGLYDAERFPQSWADNDLIFRAKRQGYKVLSTRRAIQYIYHDESTHLHLKKRLTINNYIKYLFLNQGGGNILVYSKYVIRSYPWYGVPTSLVTGVISRVLGYWNPLLNL